MSADETMLDATQLAEQLDAQRTRADELRRRL